MKLLGCEILGTAVKTLAPIMNFPQASASVKQGADRLTVRGLQVVLPKERSIKELFFGGKLIYIHFR